MKKVLIALDYDPTAQKVAEEGFSMAKAMNAGVLLLHVITDPVYYASTEFSPVMGLAGYMDPALLPIADVTGLKKAAQFFLDKSKLHLGDKAIQTVVEEGDFSDAILKVATDSHADIIVMGSHSRKWLENIVMGSVTEEVLRQTTIPLFIIPTKKRS
ncbi:MAG TPA: universal stress protein [Prolixibacteraceae bacterium]|nr:universal stress protein [Prolixibacteraceae bacterium]